MLDNIFHNGNADNGLTVALGMSDKDQNKVETEAVKLKNTPPTVNFLYRKTKGWLFH